MNGLFEKLKHYLDGARIISDWLGHDSEIVPQELAQARADKCNVCPHNQDGSALTESVANAIKEQVALKSHLELKVHGEKGLKTCNICQCYLPLKIFVPLSYQTKYMKADELKMFPENKCWIRSEAKI